MKSLLGIITIVFATSAMANATMELECAKIPKYKTEVERQYRSKANGDFYIINVVFITRRPADSLVDKVLRECITASLALDEKKNIMANAWFIPILGPDAEDVEKLDPYGPLKYIAYTASTKSVGIRSVQLPKE